MFKSNKQTNKSKTPSKAVTKSNPNMKAVSAPIAKGIVQRLPKPKFTMNKKYTDGRICISHKEYVAEVNGSINYASTAYGINPGLPVSFPWLNVLCPGYEAYKFKKLHYVFESTSPTTIAGAVILAVDFDPADAAPTTKAQIMAYQNSVRGPAWESFRYVCDKDDLNKFNQKMLRFGNLPSGQDVLLYDTGNLFVATTGQAGTTVVGELHVEYEVELITPQLDLTAYALATAAKVSSVGSPTISLPFGVAAVATGGVPILYNPSGTFNILVPGQYLLSYELNGTGITLAGSPTLVSTGNLVTLVSQTVSATKVNYVFTIQVDVPGNAFTFGSLVTTSTTLTSSLGRVAYYAYQLA
jgi:hypothetical protein